jgi:hypothetical protein
MSLHQPDALSLVVFPQAADNPINANATFNGEQSLAVDPTNPAHLVVAWMKYHVFPSPAGMVIAVSSSSNGGASWSAPIEIPHFRAHWSSADPTLAFKSDGSLYLGYIDAKGANDSSSVFVRKSTNGGLSWGAASKVIDYFDLADLAVDRPWMAVDNSGGTYDGNVYVVTKSLKYDVPPHHMYLMRSIDGGNTWSAPLLVDNAIPSGSVLAMGVPAVSVSGKLHIAYVFYNPPALPGFALVTSTNGGLSLSSSTVGTYTTNPTTNDTLLQGSYKLCANPTNANNMVLVSTRKLTSDWDIYALNTNDGGQSWSAPQRICTDAAGNGNNQDMVWANFSGTGKFAAVWRDRRANSGAQNQPYKIWGNYSLDGGATFSAADFQLSQTDGPLMIPVDGNDFIGCAVSDSVVYATWTDKRNNNTNQLFINKFRFPSVTSLNSNSVPDAKDLIFPNPNNGAFTLKFESNGEKKIEIFDANGKLIYQNKTSLSSMDLKLNAAKGYYNVKINDGKNERNLKLVID